MSHTTIDQALAAVDTANIQFTFNPGPADEKLRSLLGEFVADCVEPSGMDMDADFSTLDLRDAADIAQTLLVFHEIADEILEANADRTISLDAVSGMGVVSIDYVRIAVLQDICSDLANTWHVAIQDAGRSL